MIKTDNEVYNENTVELIKMSKPWILEKKKN